MSAGIVKAILAMEDAVTAAWTVDYPKGPKWDAVREVCRELCRRRGIVDMDRIVMGGNGQVLSVGPNETIYVRLPLAPAWASYIHHVLPVFEAMENAGLLKWPN